MEFGRLDNYFIGALVGRGRRRLVSFERLNNKLLRVGLLVIFIAAENLLLFKLLQNLLLFFLLLLVSLSFVFLLHALLLFLTFQIVFIHFV